VRLRKDAKIDLIKHVPLFAQCSKRELAEVASIADEIDLPEGKVLIREGDAGREFFVLVDGSVDVRRKGRKIDEGGAGEFFGETALLSSAPRNATVTTTSPSRALVIASRDFKALLAHAPSIQLKILQAVVERLPPSA
jgi:CRP/FNR family transcriptional regulator, cyclic AMP receptor protein